MSWSIADTAGTYPALGTASGQERAAARNAHYGVKQHVGRGASQELGHHLCEGVKMGGRELMRLEAGLEPASLVLLLGRWASLCG